MFVEIEVGDWINAPGRTARPIFAIGDIHGRFDLLQELLTAIQGFANEKDLASPALVFLGDYVDRGNHGIRVLQEVMRDDLLPGFDVVRLPGNHEQMLLSYLTSIHGVTTRLLNWLENGGSRVIREAGLSEQDAIRDPIAFRAALTRSIGGSVINRLKGLSLYWRQDDYLFVHAGIHPRLGIDMLERDWTVECLQDDDDPLWIRGPFLTFSGQHEDGIVVVHGHTPCDDPEILPNRVNLDTRAYESGRLTAACFWQDRLAIIQAIGDRQERARGWL